MKDYLDRVYFQIDVCSTLHSSLLILTDYDDYKYFCEFDFMNYCGAFNNDLVYDEE